MDFLKEPKNFVFLLVQTLPGQLMLIFKPGSDFLSGSCSKLKRRQTYAGHGDRYCPPKLLISGQRQVKDIEIQKHKKGSRQ